MSDLTLAVFKKLNYNFTVDNNASTKEFVVFRTKFSSSEEVHSFVQEIQRVTNTNYCVNIAKRNYTRKVFHKRWICQHSQYRKKPGSKKNIGCKSFIDVIIKKVNRNTKKNDHYLKGEEQLPCIITMSLEHTHSTENGEALRKLSVIPDIQKRFEEYFENGLSVCEARRFHECQLIANCDHSILANSAFNPTDRQAYYLYDKWCAKKFVSTPHSRVKLKENLSIYENKGKLEDLQNISNTDWISSLKLDNKNKSSTDFICEPPTKKIKDACSLTEKDETDKQKKQLLISESIDTSGSDTDSSQESLCATMDDSLYGTVDCSFSSSESSSVESTPKTYSRINKENIDMISIPDQKTMFMKEHFTFKHLQENLSLIKIPNNLWGISFHSNAIICARWSEDYSCRKKVVIENSLIVKAFLNEWEINLSEFMSITRIEDISNMLEKVESSIKYHKLK